MDSDDPGDIQIKTATEVSMPEKTHHLSLTSFRILIAAGSGAVFVTLVASAVLYQSTQNLITAAGWVDHTHEVLGALRMATESIDRIEYGTRPLSELSNQKQLDIARAGALQLASVALHIGHLVSDNANQTSNVERLNACASELEPLLNGASAQPDLLADRIRQCRQTKTVMEDQENRLLKERIQKAKLRSLGSFKAEFAFIGLSLFTHILLFGLLLRDAALRERLGQRVLESQNDLTRLNDTLVKSEEWFRAMIEASPNAMVMTDSSGKMEMVNAGLEHMFGYPRAELLGVSVEKLVPERLRARNAKPERSSAALAQLPNGDWEQFCGVRKDGTEFPFEIRFNQVEMGNGTKVLSAIMDISDRRQRELRIEAALKEKDVLLSEIHHRVKNNLQIIHSLLDLQSSQTQDPLVLTMLRDSQNRIRSMALIHQTLYQSKDFAQVDFGIFLNSLAPPLIASYLEHSERIRLSIHATDVHLPINAAIPCGLLVNELLSNCLKHSFPGERRGRIDIDFVHGEDGNAQLSVSDNGIGIPDGFDLTQTESLGLQLVFLLTDQLGGTMTVHRADPTCFTLRFPLKSPTSNAAQEMGLAPLPEMAGV